MYRKYPFPSVKIILIFLLGHSSIAAIAQTAPKPGRQFPDFSKDGAWCWFSDPRAIYLHGGQQNQVLSGRVKTNGTVEAGTLNTETGTIDH